MAVSSAYLTARAYSAPGTGCPPKPITWGVIMGLWFWLSIPLALFFFCCWAGIPLWLALTRWNTELSAKHAEIAAMASPAPAVAQPAPAVAYETSSPAYAGVTNPPGR